jgi:hypothetical protein
VPGDYLGTGQTQLAVYQPSTATWFIRLPNGATTTLNFGGPGLNNYVPVPGDYLGTGQTQLAVYQPSTATWFIRLPNGATITLNFGGPGLNNFIPVPGDYLGTGQTQLAVFQPSTGLWYIRLPDGSTLQPPRQFGATGLADVPVETTAGALAALGLIPTSAHVVVAKAPSGGTANAAMPLLSSVQVGAPVVSGPLAASASSGSSAASAIFTAQAPPVGNRPVAQAFATIRRRPFVDN